MDSNGHSFLEKVLKIVRDEQSENKLLIQFKHPKELETLLDLDVTEGVSDADLEKCVREVLQHSVKTNRAEFRNQLYGGTDPYGLSGAWLAEAFNTSQTPGLAASSLRLRRLSLQSVCAPVHKVSTGREACVVDIRYTFEVAPAFTLIEMEMLRHILHLFGMPQGDGIFSPGGSLSMLYSIVAARYKAFPQVKSKGMRALPELVLFTSEDSHYSIKKAAHWLGFGTESIKTIKTNDQGQMLVDDLDAAVKEEKNRGRYPLLVNATAGTTVLGAIDDLSAVAEVCKKYGIWLHVDACWGGSLILSKNYKHKLNGIDRADSIAWNPHKMAGAPLQCSLFLVKERGLLHEANSASAQYLFQQDKFYDVTYDTGDKSVQCGRKIDAFKLWTMWKARGDTGLSLLTDQTMNIARFCLDTITKRPGFRLVSDVLQCPNVCFWYIPTSMRGKMEDEKWWELMHKITPKIKELLTVSSCLMIAYSPLRHHKNFFRLAYTFHPKVDKTQVLNMLQAIQECGEGISLELL